MRGPDEQTAGMFSYLSPEARVRADHPLRAIRLMTDQVLRELSPRFDRMYSDMGRPSIPPEQLLRALLLQGLYTIRSERLLIEEIDYSILFRWFIGLSLDEPIWSPTTFSKNRDRLLQADVASAFFEAVVHQAREAGLMSDEHFTVDGTMLDAWASLKSFQRKDASPMPPPDDPGNPTINFHGETRKNETHQSTTDPDAQLYRKGQGKKAKLAYLGHVLFDNRHGLVANVCTTVANGYRGMGGGAADARADHRRRRPWAATSISTSAGSWDPPARGASRPTWHRRDRGSPYRWAYHPSSWLRGESAQTQTGRTSLWVDEDDRRPAQAAASWWRAGRSDRDLHRSGLRLGPSPHPVGEARMTADRHAPERA